MCDLIFFPEILWGFRGGWRETKFHRKIIKPTFLNSSCRRDFHWTHPYANNRTRTAVSVVYENKKLKGKLCAHQQRGKADLFLFPAWVFLTPPFFLSEDGCDQQNNK